MAVPYSNDTYREIVIDKQVNYPNAVGITYKLTAEEFQDLLHHTHRVSDLIGADGAVLNAGEVTKEQFNELKDAVETLKTKIQAIQNAYITPAGDEELTQRVIALEGTISSMSSAVTNIENRLQSLETVVGNTAEGQEIPSTSLLNRVKTLEAGSGSGFIIDYDIDTPGVQDIDGNTTG